MDLLSCSIVVCHNLLSCGIYTEVLFPTQTEFSQPRSLIHMITTNKGSYIIANNDTLVNKVTKLQCSHISCSVQSSYFKPNE